MASEAEGTRSRATSAAKVASMQALIDEGLASGEARAFDLPTFLSAMAAGHEAGREGTPSTVPPEER